MTSPRPALVMHTADVHIGGNPEAREERAFVRAVDLALETDVDAVLVVGDLFDHARVSDDILEWTAGHLNRLDRPVVILPGNHDTFHERSVYHRLGLADRCPDAILLDDTEGSVCEVPGTDVVIWGRAMVEHEPAFRPLLGAPTRTHERWSVIAAHGLVMDESLRGRSSPIEHDELASLDCDYVALGHCHQYEEVRTEPFPVIYPGATAASQGSAPGVVMVEFEPERGVHHTWTPLGD